MAFEYGQPRMRVFAGPNGSGKSTVIEHIRAYRVNNRPVDFGYYINADDIAGSLRRTGQFSFSEFDFEADAAEFYKIASTSGLLNEDFPPERFHAAYELTNNMISCRAAVDIDRLAQIVADYIRRKMLMERKRFSFETVFSHHSKLDIMRLANEAGYKVYLYFVSTESPKINMFRVEARIMKGGHAVSAERVEKRYYRAMEQLHDAAQLAYQAYFFDNSDEGIDFKLFAHFKVIGGKKVWDEINEANVPGWFKTYYSAKVATDGDQ